MRVLVVAVGARGDVAPCTDLGAGPAGRLTRGPGPRQARQARPRNRPRLAGLNRVHSPSGQSEQSVPGR